ncbi:dihydroxy-acid dehydratase, partial [Acinetobacter baumannii]
WEDFDRLSKAVPLITRVYPNGSADVNGFEAAGGMPFVIRELVSTGLLHGDLLTVAGDSLADYGRKPVIEGDALAWVDPGPSGDESILRAASAPF